MERADGKATERFASPVLVEALRFAEEAHRAVRQSRKGTAFPYLVHPLRVAETLYRTLVKEEKDEVVAEAVIAAAILHDVIEDTTATWDEIAANPLLGERVADLVKAVSEDKSLDWEVRKEHTVEQVSSPETSIDVLLLIAADKLDGVRSIRDSIADRGREKAFKLFRRGEPVQSRYYRSIADALVARTSSNRLFRTLQLEVQELFPEPGRSQSPFSVAVPVRSPEQVRPFLGDPAMHWKPGRSAYELAEAWVRVGDIPADVRSALEGTSFAACRLIEGFFERKVELRTPGAASQTDLMLLVELATESLGVIAVEGKAGEPFDKLAEEWLAGERENSTTRAQRLDALCKTLGIDASAATTLRYQLLHRTASAIYEAQRYGARDALVLVHSFAHDPASIRDFSSFGAALGITDVAAGHVAPTSQLIDGVRLQLGWVDSAPAFR